MIPSKEKLAAFNKVGKLVLEQMKEATEEIQILKQLQEIDYCNIVKLLNYHLSSSLKQFSP